MDWIEAPVFRSLLEPLKVLGMPRNVGVLVGTLTLAMVIGAGMVWFLGVTAVLVIVSNVMARHDAWFFDIMRDLIKLPEAMD